MTDWTAATPTLANGEYPTSYLPVRVPGAPDLFKQVPISRFVTTDANGKTETASTVQFAFGMTADAGTIVGGRGAGGSLVVRTPSLNGSFDSGMAIDGSFNAQTLLTAVNLTAFGVFSGGGYQADMVFRTSIGQTISERMRLTAIGNLGIGTSAPVARLSAHATNPARGILQSIRNDGTSGLTGAQIQLTQNSIADWAMGQVPGVSAFGVWRDRNAAADGVELMRLEQGGNLLLGQTSAGVQNLNSLALEASTYGRILFNHSGTASGSYFAYFSYNGTGIASISQNGTTGVSFNTTSDRRVKKNIFPAGEAGSVIDRIQVRSFDWRRKGNDPVSFGLIAQELFEVMPLAVKRGDDGAVDAAGNIPEDGEIWGIDPSKLVPLLIREIQSMRARLAVLEAGRG